MKCPKCGFNSFDHLESCRKCGQDLNEVKTRFNLRSIFFPERAAEPPAESLPESLASPASNPVSSADEWSWGDLPEESPLEDLLSNKTTEIAVKTEIREAEAEAAEDEEEPAGLLSPEPAAEPQPNLFAAEEETDDDDFFTAAPTTEQRSPAASGFSHHELFDGTLSSADAENFLAWDDEESVEEEMGSSPAAAAGHAAAIGLLPRFGASLVDLVVLTAAFLLFAVAGELALSDGGGLLPSFATLMDQAIPYFLVLFALCFGYFTLFHFLLGQTPGKILFSLRIEGEQGGAPSLTQAFLRSVGGLLSLLPFGLGFLAAGSAPDGRGWNDRLAGTRVAAADPPAEDFAHFQ